MKIKSILLMSLLLIPNHDYTSPTKHKEKDECAVLLKQQKDNEKVRLVLLAALVTIVTIKLTGKTKMAQEFDKLIMFLWNK